MANRTTDPESLRQRVLAAVLKLGVCSRDQVVAEVSPYISSADAAHAARQRLARERRRQDRKQTARRPEQRKQHTPEELVERGKRDIVSWMLTRESRKGNLRRAGLGLYGPPLPKIHIPEEEAILPMDGKPQAG